MINKNKDRILRDICLNHSTRSDRDISRICPSKLSKQELEDVYYKLIDSNFRLKSKIKSLDEKVTALSTKLQRMTNAQRSSIMKEKGSGSGTRAMVNEQKELIQDLQMANQRLVEKIKLLNMQLCSAKQFVNSSSQGMRCPKCFIRNSTSMLNSKSSEGNLRASTSCQYIDKAVMTSRSISSSVSVNTEQETKMDTNLCCKDNKCVTEIEELKQKITGLEQELSKASESHVSELSKLEHLGVSLRHENITLRDVNVAQEDRIRELNAKLRAVDTGYNELQSELILERSRVTELETQLKINSFSSANIAKIIEEHINKAKAEESSKKQTEVRNQLDKLSVISEHSSKYSDDSGYNDSSNETQKMQTLRKENEQLLKKIEELQAKIDALQRDKENFEKKSTKRIMSDAGVTVNINNFHDDLTINGNSPSKNKEFPEQNKDKDTKLEVIKPVDSTETDSQQFTAFFVNIENTSSPLSNVNNNKNSKVGSVITDPDNNIIHKQEKKENDVKGKEENGLPKITSPEKSPNSDSDKKDRTRTLSKSLQHKTQLPNKVPSNKVMKTKDNKVVDVLKLEVADSSDCSAKTYVVDEDEKSVGDAEESADNTDCEISSLSDLPSEKDGGREFIDPRMYPGGRPVSVLSPGEEVAVSCSSPTTDHATLSEGELPGFRHVRQLSLGEKQMDTKSKRDFNDMDMSSPIKVQRALAAVSAELARCRRLLRTDHLHH